MPSQMPHTAFRGHSPRYWRQGVSFIKAELEAGLVFSMIAVSSRDQEKIARNAADASTAFDVARGFVKKVRLTAQDSVEINRGFEKLRANLIWLQNFPD